jgi:hypothetical protein
MLGAAATAIVGAALAAPSIAAIGSSNQSGLYQLHVATRTP